MFDDDYEDRMHDIREDERQEKPVSDAAQTAVEDAVTACLGGTLELIGTSMGKSPVNFSRQIVTETARTVLAVLSETHEVVELPEGEGDGRVTSWAWGTTAQWATVTEPFDHVALAPHEAREYGAELFAAARVAEGGGSRG